MFYIFSFDLVKKDHGNAVKKLKSHIIPTVLFALDRDVLENGDKGLHIAKYLPQENYQIINCSNYEPTSHM